MADSAEIVEASLLPADDGSDDAPGPGRRRPPTLVVVLAGALVVALVAAGTLAWMLWHGASRSDRQAAVVALVEEYTASFDAHDLPGVRATLADGASFSAGEHLDDPVVGPHRGKDLDDFYGSMFRAQVHLTTDGPVHVTGNGPYRVVAVQTVRYSVAGVAVTEQGVSLFSLVQLQDRPVILEHLWWRPLAAQGPSMLWAQ